jgi:hypothetical protein
MNKSRKFREQSRASKNNYSSDNQYRENKFQRVKPKSVDLSAKMTLSAQSKKGKKSFIAAKRNNYGLRLVI